jgi:hypothetical protein
VHIVLIRTEKSELKNLKILLIANFKWLRTSDPISYELSSVEINDINYVGLIFRPTAIDLKF